MKGTGGKPLIGNSLPLSLETTLLVAKLLCAEQRGVLLGLALEYQGFSLPPLEAYVGM